MYSPKERTKKCWVLARFIAGEQAVKSLFAAVSLHVGVNALGVMLYSLINVDTGGQVVGVALWETRMVGGTCDILVESFLSSSLTPLDDRVGVIMIVVDWIALDIHHDRFKLLDRQHHACIFRAS